MISVATGVLKNAVTSGILIQDSLPDAARKALAYLRRKSSTAWCVDSVTLAGAATPEVQIQRAKQAIAKAHGLPTTRAIPFFRRAGGERRYFYLRPPRAAENASPFAVCEQVEDASVILRLCLLSALLNSTEFGNRVSSVETIGPRLFVGVRSASRGAFEVSEALEIGLVLHRCELITNLHARSFSTVRGTQGKIASGIWMGAGSASKLLSLLDPASLSRLDGRKAKFEDIDFTSSGIRTSKVYFLNALTDFFLAELQNAGVVHTRRRFAPNYVLPGSFIRVQDLTSTTIDVVIVNATDQKLTEAQCRTIEAGLRVPHQSGRLTFRSVRFDRDATPQRSGENGRLAEIDAKNVYLFLNLQNCGTATSIRVKDEWLCNPYDAYDDLKCDAAQAHDVDPYTFTKFWHLYNQAEGYVPLQGLDLRAAEGVLQFDNETEEALRRCALELAVKASFAIGAFPVSAKAPPGEYTLVWTTKKRIARKTDPVKIVSVTEVTVGGGVLKVLSARRYVDADVKTLRMLGKSYSFLGNGIKSEKFFLVCNETKQVLEHFSGLHIPKILLSEHYVGIDEALSSMERSDGLSSSGLYSRAEKWCIVPFYVPPYSRRSLSSGWRDVIYVEDCGNYLRYFAPSRVPLRVKPRFSNLHDLMISQGDRPLESGLLQNPLAQLYLGTMTNGIARVNENSKTSLLEKIARLAGLDT